MTGTASTEAGEFAHTYDLEVVPSRRTARWSAPTSPTSSTRPRTRSSTPRPTTSRSATRTASRCSSARSRSSKSEKLSRLLEKRGIPHAVLNAKQHEREAEIVTQAGQLGAVTVATNMAGRGVDILLGGNPEGLAARRSCCAEGADAEEDAGEVRRSSLARVQAPSARTRATRSASSAASTCSAPSATRAAASTTSCVAAPAARATRARAASTSRSKTSSCACSRPALMSWVMGKAFPDDVPLEAKMVTKAIERAQRTVEDRNFEIRKDVLKYDEVMNEQRKVIYQRRQQILDGGDLRDESLDAIEGAIDHVVDARAATATSPRTGTSTSSSRQAQDVFPTRVTQRAARRARRAPEQVFELLHGDAVEQYEAKESAVGAETLREIERRVMLSVIDQHWREHLYEMDYLRRASTSGPWASRTRSPSGSARASTCSRR